jgi:hypothetical protein
MNREDVKEKLEQIVGKLSNIARVLSHPDQQALRTYAEERMADMREAIVSLDTPSSAKEFAPSESHVARSQPSVIPREVRAVMEVVDQMAQLQDRMTRENTNLSQTLTRTNDRIKEILADFTALAEEVDDRVAQILSYDPFSEESAQALQELSDSMPQDEGVRTAGLHVRNLQQMQERLLVAQSEGIGVHTFSSAVVEQAVESAIFLGEVTNAHSRGDFRSPS